MAYLLLLLQALTIEFTNERRVMSSAIYIAYLNRSCANTGGDTCSPCTIVGVINSYS